MDLVGHCLCAVGGRSIKKAPATRGALYLVPSLVESSVSLSLPKPASPSPFVPQHISLHYFPDFVYDHAVDSYFGSALFGVASGRPG